MANKSPIRNSKGSGKVIQNPFLGLYHHQKLTNSSDW